jgi:3-phosphoshikimate 1-carboxyvinyltransferase
VTHHPDSFRAWPVERVGGTIEVPGDKSISHRALMLGAVAEGTTVVHGFLASEDCLATETAMRALGVPIERDAAGSVRIEGVGLSGLSAPAARLDLGNSGTAIRLLMGLLAGQRFDCELTGDASLRLRPMERVAGPLRTMGAQIDTAPGGTPPVHVRGGAKLRGIDCRLPMASAQVKSAILLAALYAEGRTTVHSPGPSRDHTERMLESMGVALDLAEEGKGHRVSLQGHARLRALELTVPGDFSSAAFFLVAGCIGARDGLSIRNVGVNPSRTGLLEILRAMGAQIELKNERRVGAEPVADLHVRQSELKGIDVPAELVPLAIDEFPVLFVAAAAARGTTTVTGAEELRKKETDRIAVMARGLRAVGIEAEELPDGLRVVGGAMVGGVVDSSGDHRVAMAFAVASLRAGGPIEISRTAEVATSFPNFLKVAAAAGLRVEHGGAALHEGAAPRVVTIDGPSGSGKGTISRRLAARLGWHYLDSGALYRLTALAALGRGIDLEDSSAVTALALRLDVRFAPAAEAERIYLDDVEVAGELRTERVGEAASRVAALPAVREALLGRQRDFARAPGLIADGRDMGTVVFPGAQLKVFLTASAEERAMRRHKQLKEKGIDVSLPDLSWDIAQRDARDATREVAPLRPADDAHVIDSTGLTPEEVIGRILPLLATAGIKLEGT